MSYYDWTALKALYEATDGDNWKYNDGWEIVKNDEPPTDCYLGNLLGVDLNNDGRVDDLTLFNNQLSGNIPPELGNLTNLNTLSLGMNQLSGNIPSELGNLGNLENIYLYDNQISGNIPSELGNLTNLNALNLSNNQLSGNIPPELGNLDSLRSLYLKNNQLSGKIPYVNIVYDPDFELFPYEVYFHNNYFIYDDFENFDSGYGIPYDYRITPQYYRHNGEQNIIVDASTEAITLNAPFEVANNYISSQWYKNDLKVNGAIDSVLHLNTPQLNDLGVYQLHVKNSNITYVSDPITVGLDYTNCHIDDWTALKALYEATNGDNWKNNTGWEMVKNEERPYDCYLKSLHGVSLNDKSRAERLELANNNLQGTIPDELINLSDLQIFDISDNQLSGSLPDFLSNTRLSDFYIQSNYFTCGDLQPLIGNFSPLEYSPQKYMHNGPEFYPAQSSNDLISLSAPFNDSGNITYSWYKNGTLIENENDSTLHLNNIQLEDLGWYSLHIVKNDCVESNGIISSVTFISDSIKVGNYFPHKNLTFAAYFLKKK